MTDTEKEILERLRAIETELALTKQKVTSVEEKHDRLLANIAKALWIVAGGFIMAIVGFITGGGLNVSK